MAPPTLPPWPASLEGTPAVAVIDRAIERGRLSHSLLITGEDHDLLAEVATCLADRLLNPLSLDPARRRPLSANPVHPDLFHVRPEKKMRQIGAEATRELIGKLQVSATAAPTKVAIFHECDRMHLSAANIFLKTLEEPPAHTHLLLLTTRPYALLPTIRSRCLHFRFPLAPNRPAPDGWSPWLEDYQAWLGRLVAGITDKKTSADLVFQTYGLTARFTVVLEHATSEQWKAVKPTLPEDMTDDEQIAYETGIANGLRLRLLADLEHATRAFARAALAQGHGPAAPAFAQAIADLEHKIGLLRLNLNVAAALEAFLLNSLRLWTKR